MNTLRLSVLLPIFMLVGCMTTVDYPTTWAPVAKELMTGCKSITGAYLNRGDVAGGGSVKLTEVLLEQNSKVGDFQYLSIAFDQNMQLVISGVRSPESAPVQLSNIEKYECKNGSLVFDLSSLKSGDNVVSVGSSKRRLYKSGDYLVVESAESGVGIVLLIPVVASANNWFRFPMYERKSENGR